ncbi:ABC transporter ATP-binding protein [Microvirga antarctica]|uniref:ABC transporter ATP-binding protein n=1 Tax=Microvirga antarctica TaxID=2819233 RepID=UPI001B313285|nr:ABC transporter ATP-binding protein [Microvirga antarctica]
MLDVADLHVSYGMIRAVQGVTLHVDKGEIVALVGSNGAGKSSTLLALAGLIKSTGSVRLKDRRIDGASAHIIVRSGMILVPEGRGTIGTLTVEENLEMGAYTRSDGWRKDLDKIYQRFAVLESRRTQMAQTLSGGEQQMLALARALLARPSLMLLDEPSMGLAPLIVRQVFEIIEELNREGTTILLVEQNASAALRVAHRAYVMESGRIVASGNADEVARDEQTSKAYLS